MDALRHAHGTDRYDGGSPSRTSGSSAPSASLLRQSQCPTRRKPVTDSAPGVFRARADRLDLYRITRVAAGQSPRAIAGLHDTWLAMLDAQAAHPTRCVWKTRQLHASILRKKAGRKVSLSHMYVAMRHFADAGLLAWSHNAITLTAALAGIPPGKWSTGNSLPDWRVRQREKWRTGRAKRRAQASSRGGHSGILGGRPNQIGDLAAQNAFLRADTFRRLDWRWACLPTILGAYAVSALRMRFLPSTPGGACAIQTRRHAPEPRAQTACRHGLKQPAAPRIEEPHVPRAGSPVPGFNDALSPPPSSLPMFGSGLFYKSALAFEEAGGDAQNDGGLLADPTPSGAIKLHGVACSTQALGRPEPESVKAPRGRTWERPAPAHVLAASCDLMDAEEARLLARQYPTVASSLSPRSMESLGTAGVTKQHVRDAVAAASVETRRSTIRNPAAWVANDAKRRAGLVAFRGRGKRVTATKSGCLAGAMKRLE